MGVSKFHTPPVLLLNAVAMSEPNVVAVKEFPVASRTVTPSGLMTPTVSPVKLAAWVSELEARTRTAVPRSLEVNLGFIWLVVQVKDT